MTTWMAGLSCIVFLVLYLAVAFAFPVLDMKKNSLWVEPIVVLMAVHTCAWLVQRRSADRLTPLDLRRLFVGAGIAFVTVDEGSALLNYWLNPDAVLPRYPVATAIIAIIFDIGIVAAMVYLTVPLAAMVYRRKAVA